MHLGISTHSRSSCLFLTLMTISLAVFGTGCGGSPVSSTAGGDKATSNDAANNVTSDVETDKLAGSKQTVAVFLDSLRRGDETTANSMLTTKARQELQKTAWVMQPLGTPEGRYTIGRAGFPYSEQNVVLVECRWQEPPIEPEPELVMDIVCELYEESEGWRIAGIAVTVAGESEALVIDFEDGAGLQEMLDVANGVAPATTPATTPATFTPPSMPATDAAQFALPGQQPGGTSNNRLPPNYELPNFPEYPAIDNTQIALPPNSGNVLR